MPIARDTYPRTRFGDVEFPGESHDLDGTYRKHIHEYPHSPGGDPEKLGRALYTCSIRGNFGSTFQAYPGLYPDGMNKLRGYFESGTTLNLRHPTVGEFAAFITRWKQVKTPKNNSGEIVDIEFLEDTSTSFALNDTVDTLTFTSIGPSAAQLASDLAAVQAQLNLSANDVNAFDALQTTVASILAIQDQVNLYDSALGDKVGQVIGLCAQLDASISMQDARAWPIVDDLQQVWLNAVTINQDLLAQQATIELYPVPFTMTLVQIAVNLYNDASRQTDLISLNSNVVDDPLRVMAGTLIRYYPNNQQQTIQATTSP